MKMRLIIVKVARIEFPRRFKEAVLKAVYVKDGRVNRAEFRDVFAALFSRPEFE
ncbi:MAG: hypothetical protein H0U16_12675 [Actinobacteria bacterium]|nr:hypothetical protein [Actinomycetota bacterium]